MTELWKLSATEIARMIEAGDTNCEKVTAACLERIEVREAEVDVALTRIWTKAFELGIVDLCIDMQFDLQFFECCLVRTMDNVWVL